MFWRDFARREISTWPTRAQWVIYGAVALLVVDLVWFFLGSPSGPDALAFFVVAIVCVFAGWRTWRDQRTYMLGQRDRADAVEAVERLADRHMQRPTKIGVSRSVYAEASVSRRRSIRCMKSAGSSHSKAVMNSWSSIPNE